MKPSEAIKELVKKWENISPGYDNPNIEFQDDSTFISDLTALISEHYVSREEHEAERKRLLHCGSCGKPLSRDCPECKHLWES